MAMPVEPRGLSPVLASVIILALTLVVVIGVISWVTGLWGSLGGVESLKVLPDSYMESRNGETLIALHILNTGSVPLVVVKVEVVGLGTVTRSFAMGYVAGTAPAYGTLTQVTVDPGKDVYLYATIKTSTVPGAIYAVRIYTASGNVYIAQLMVK